MFPEEPSPVTVQQRAGQRPRSVAIGLTCYPHRGQATTSLAASRHHANARAENLCQAGRARSSGHTHSIDILAMAWVRVIWRASTDRKSYTPSLHGIVVASTARQGR
jgi:hypothetical protein